MDEIQYHFQQYKKALKKLKDAVGRPLTEDIIRDGTIQRFEFTFELAWKLMQKINRVQGFETPSPRSSIKQCFQLGFFTEDLRWLDMIKDRNLTSHTYCEDIANRIYRDIQDFVVLLGEFEANAEIFIDREI